MAQNFIFPFYTRNPKNHTLPGLTSAAYVKQFSTLIEPEDRWIGWIYDVPKKVLLLSATVLFLSVLRILWSKLSTSQKLTTLTTDAQDRNEGKEVDFFQIKRNINEFFEILGTDLIFDLKFK